jgi:hypothetical protein
MNERSMHTYILSGKVLGKWLTGFGERAKVPDGMGRLII